MSTVTAAETALAAETATATEKRLMSKEWEESRSKSTREYAGSSTDDLGDDTMVCLLSCGNNTVKFSLLQHKLRSYSSRRMASGIHLTMRTMTLAVRCLKIASAIIQGIHTQCNIHLATHLLLVEYTLYFMSDGRSVRIHVW